MSQAQKEAAVALAEDRTAHIFLMYGFTSEYEAYQKMKKLKQRPGETVERDDGH